MVEGGTIGHHLLATEGEGAITGLGPAHTPRGDISLKVPLTSFPCRFIGVLLVLRIEEHRLYFTQS